jgi:hypothetical protein
VGAIVVQPLQLPVKVGQPLFGRLQLGGERGHALAVRRSVLPAIEQFVARFGQRGGGGMLRQLGRARGGLRADDRFLAGLRFPPRRVGRVGRVAPAGKDHARLGHADAFAYRLVAFGGARLPTQRGDLAFQPGQQVHQPFEIGFGGAQLLFRIAPADVQAGDPRRFLQHHAPFGGARGDHRRDAALADQRGLCAPVAASAKTSATSLARTSLPLTR